MSELNGMNVTNVENGDSTTSGQLTLYETSKGIDVNGPYDLVNEVIERGFVLGTEKRDVADISVSRVYYYDSYTKSFTQKGGFVESVRNIKENGRVYDDACVYGNAVVREFATICNDARVYGNAEVKGQAVIKDEANVYGHAIVTDNAIVERKAIVCDSLIRESCVISGHSKVFGSDTVISGNTYICDSMRIVEGGYINSNNDIFYYRDCEDSNIAYTFFRVNEDVDPVEPLVRVCTEYGFCTAMTIDSFKREILKNWFDNLNKHDVYEFLNGLSRKEMNLTKLSNDITSKITRSLTSLCKRYDAVVNAALLSILGEEYDKSKEEED